MDGVNHFPIEDFFFCVCENLHKVQKRKAMVSIQKHTKTNVKCSEFEKIKHGKSTDVHSSFTMY